MMPLINKAIGTEINFQDKEEKKKNPYISLREVLKVPHISIC